MRTAAVLLTLAVAALAQPTIPGGHLVYTQTNPPTVAMYDPGTGMSTTLSTSAMFNATTGCIVSDQGEAVVCDTLGFALYRVDVLGTVTPVVTALVNTPLRIIKDHFGDFIVTGGAWQGSGGQLMRITTGGTVSNITGLSGPYGICLHPSGDYMVTLFLSGDLVRVSPGGIVTTVATGLGQPLGVAMFPNGDYAVASGSPDQIWRVPAGGGAPTVWTASPPLGQVKGVTADGQGGFYVTEAGGATGSRVMHIAPDGTTVTPVLGNAAFSGFAENVAVSPTLVGPYGPTTGPTGTFGLAIDFAQHPNTPYLCFMASSVFPGIAFPGDPRGTPLNPDPLFLLSFGVGYPPFTQGWSGNLDGGGSAAVTVDLTPLPAGAFANSLVHFQVALLDPMAPTGLLQLSNPFTVRFQ